MPAGVFMLIEVRDVEASLNILRREFAELGYSSIAHVGRLMPAPDGWCCLYGQSDQVLDIPEAFNDAASQIESFTQVFTAHVEAAKIKE